MSAFSVKSFAVVFTVCIGILLAAGAAAPPKTSAPNITEEQHRAATLEVGVLIREKNPKVLGATLIYPASVFGLNPKQNQYGADVLLVGTVTIVVERGVSVERPWCAYCKNGNCVAAEDLQLGNLAESAD